MTAATVQRILKEIGEPRLQLHRVRSGGGYFYFEFDDPKAGVYDTRSVFTPHLSDISLESWVYEGRELVRRCKLLIDVQSVARMARPSMVGGLA